MPKRIVGIDPGDYGALAVMENGTVIGVHDMPVVKVKGREEVDVGELMNLFAGVCADILCVELLHAMPAGKGKMGGSAANYKRGGYCYLFRAIACAKGAQLVEVLPRVWQKEFFIAGEDTKGQSYQVASRLFPDLELKTPRGRILDGRTDAVLISEYARRKLNI